MAAPTVDSVFAATSVVVVSVAAFETFAEPAPVAVARALDVAVADAAAGAAAEKAGPLSTGVVAGVNTPPLSEKPVDVDVRADTRLSSVVAEPTDTELVDCDKACMLKTNAASAAPTEALRIRCCDMLRVTPT